MTHYFTPKKVGGGRGLTTIFVRGVQLTLYTSPGVFSKKGIDKGTLLLMETMTIPEQGAVLDLGTGYGVLGVFLAKANPRLRVYMTDVNPRAVELARQNAKLNRVDDRVVVIRTNLYKGLEKHFFKAIYTNPPLSCGWNVIEKMISEAPQHLVENGFMEAVFAKGEEKALSIGKLFFTTVEVVKRKKGYTIIRFSL